MESVKLSFFGLPPYKNHKGIKKTKKIVVEYLDGSKELDELLIGKESNERGFVLSNQKEGVLFTYGLNNLSLIKKGELLSWGYLKNSDVIKQSKSVLGRAAAGTLLLGPLGGIIGGMSGLGEKSLNSDYYLQIDYIDSSNLERALVCGFKERELGKLLFMFEQDYKDKFKSLTESEVSENKAESSVAKKLLELKELETQGVITEEEFIKLKSKVIDA